MIDHSLSLPLSLFLAHTHSFSFSLRWQRSAWKGPYALHTASQQSPQGCPRNSANVCQVEHRSFPTSEGGMSVASFLNSSFLQVINAVMLKPVHIHKVPQASEDLCPTKLQTCSTYTHATSMHTYKHPCISKQPTSARLCTPTNTLKLTNNSIYFTCLSSGEQGVTRAARVKQSRALSYW